MIMKNIFNILIIAAAAVFSAGCSGLLDVESKTAVTSDYLYSTPEGLTKAIVGLYTKDRSFATGDAVEYIVMNLDYCTDLMVFRGGTAATLARLDNTRPNNTNITKIWEQNYQIIGKANEIITAAEEMGLDDPTVKRAYGEAKLFRARSYFMLYQRFERLYLNLEPTSLDNAFGRVFRPASKAELFEVIKTDLDDAIANLEWEIPAGTSGSPDYGRFTKAVAKHVRAQVAMWEEDWTTAINECEDIFENPNYGMLSRTIDVFNGPDLRNSEVLYAYQMSSNIGGGASSSDGVMNGHRVSLNVTPNYKKIGGMKNSADEGGYGWGRVYPNTYLLSLYDQEKDNRYKELFKFEYYYNDPDNLPAGAQLGDPVPYDPANAASYLETMHPMSVKYADFGYTNSDNPDRMSSFKDLIVYRLAETYLMCAEAYFHRDGGSGMAATYFNETYARAGNDPKSTITLQDLLDEYARELHFEGVRWPLLKRLGLLGDAVRAHAGDLKSEDPKLNADYAQARTNFRENRDWRWPIPESALNLMPGYGQNEGWL